MIPHNPSHIAIHLAKYVCVCVHVCPVGVCESTKGQTSITSGANIGSNGGTQNYLTGGGTKNYKGSPVCRGRAIVGKRKLSS